MLFNQTLDRQLKKRPREVKFCSRCVVSNQKPRITFDKKNVCGACQYSQLKHNTIDWKEREEELVTLLDRFRSRDGSYDCIVPGSGGKDSGYVAHIMKYQYGMHPLTVTWAPFIYTAVGWNNYVAFKDSGFDSMLFFPNGKLHRKLTWLAFELHGDPLSPFTYGIKNFAFHIAIKFSIPLIIFGENGEIEHGGSHKNMWAPFEAPENFKTFYFKGSGIDELLLHGMNSKLFSNEELSDNSFEFYKMPDSKLMQNLNPEMHWMSYYKKWDSQENYHYALKNTGFQASSVRSEGTYSKYTSLDDKVLGFNYYLAYIKYGIARATFDVGIAIRDGKLTRDKGVALVKKYDHEFPKKYFHVFLDYLNISEETFWEVIDFYRGLSPHLWVNINGKWKLRHTVWGGGADD